jgi:hypothetical protein
VPEPTNPPVTPVSPKPTPPTPQVPPVQPPASPAAPTAPAPPENTSVLDEEVAQQIQLHAVRSAASVGRTARMNDLMDTNIVAKPLSMGDGFFNLRPKSPDVVFRAIAHRVATNSGLSTMRYEQARGQGYVNVTVADVAGTVPPSCIRENGQQIVNGDLILMKIGRKDYRGALKWKDLQAIRSTQRATTIETGENELRRAAMETNMPPRLARKLSPFTPSPKELEKDFGGED